MSSQVEHVRVAVTLPSFETEDGNDRNVTDTQRMVERLESIALNLDLKTRAQRIEKTGGGTAGAMVDLMTDSPVTETLQNFFYASRYTLIARTKTIVILSLCIARLFPRP